MFAPRQKHDTRRTVLPTDSRTPTKECYSNPPRHQVRPHDSRLDSGSAVATISTHSAVTVLSRWIPGTAKFTAVGQHARGTGCIQVSTSALHASLANSHQVAAAQQLQPVQPAGCGVVMLHSLHPSVLLLVTTHPASIHWVAPSAAGVPAGWQQPCIYQQRRVRQRLQVQQLWCQQRVRAAACSGQL